MVDNLLKESNIQITAIDAAQKIVNELLQMDGIRVFGICGLGGTGKSTTCRTIYQRNLTASVVIETDWYLSQSSAFRRSAILNALEKKDCAEIEHWSDPSAWYDWSAFQRDLETLRRTGCLTIRDAWRQSSGEKDLEVNLAIKDLNHAVIIVDGIYLLHPNIKSNLDRVLLLNGDIETARMRAESRDSHRVDNPYLAFKAELTSSFDVPYFAKFREHADTEAAIT